MFGLFKNKTKNPEAEKVKNLEKVDGYKKAIKAIEYFMAIYEWEKAKQAISEIKDKELTGFNELVEHLKKEDDDEIVVAKEIGRQKKKYEKRVKELNSLEEKLRVKKDAYDKKREKERFKVRFDYIRKEINTLTRTNKNESALALLSNFLEENKNKDIVIKFYNTQKKRLLKNMEKQKRAEENKLKQNAKLEALKLIGENINNYKSEKVKKLKSGFFHNIKEKLNFYKKVKENLKKKQLLDEISLLIEEDSKIKQDLASQKLENIHKGLIKEISQKNMIGYNFYGKILGADKISGDAFGFKELKDKYEFFIGDATGHGIRAGFIITLLSRLFNESIKKSLQEIVFNINNGLKQDLKTRNFITGIFFEILRNDISKLRYVGMGHEPMLIYKKKEKKVEKLIPGGLAAGIRLIKDYNDIKVKEINLEDGDIVLTYSDGITEAKSEDGVFYGIDRLKKSFEKIVKSGKYSVSTIYDHIIKDVKAFQGGTHFSDDVTLLLLERDTKNDIVDENSEYIKDLKLKGKISKGDIKNIKGKTKEEIEEELKKIAKEKKTKNIIKNLEALYYTGEIIKLKQEAIRFIKDGFIDKKINYYLKKAIENEEKYKIEQKEQRIRNKYNVLKELMKKGDYITVIQEAEDIISKDGNI